MTVPGAFWLSFWQKFLINEELSEPGPGLDGKCEEETLGGHGNQHRIRESIMQGEKLKVGSSAPSRAEAFTGSVPPAMPWTGTGIEQ